MGLTSSQDCMNPATMAMMDDSGGKARADPLAAEPINPSANPSA